MATVLVIEDNPQMRKTMARILAAANHRVIEADHGAAGLREFRSHRPQLVITDILMPEKEGIETIRDLRRESPEVPIIAVSGGGLAKNPKFLDIAKKFGAIAALEKPFRANELVALVARALAAAERGSQSA